ncbi:MAG TPA: hypothetical protein DCX67_02845 [Opitutae bacterium]|nr:hypothetical protein [Opitutae bacterium]
MHSNSCQTRIVKVDNDVIETRNAPGVIPDAQKQVEQSAQTGINRRKEANSSQIHSALKILMPKESHRPTHATDCLFVCLAPRDTDRLKLKFI